MKYMGKGSLSSTVSSLNLFDFLQHFIIYPLLCVGSGEKSKIVQFKIKLLQRSLYFKKKHICTLELGKIGVIFVLSNNNFYQSCA